MGRGDGRGCRLVTVERGERDAQRFWLQLIDALADTAGDELVERVSPVPQFAGALVVERFLGQLQRLDEWSGLPLTAFYGFCAARARSERWPAALLQAAMVALIGGFLIGLKALLH